MLRAQKSRMDDNAHRRGVPPYVHPKLAAAASPDLAKFAAATREGVVHDIKISLLRYCIPEGLVNPFRRRKGHSVMDTIAAQSHRHSEFPG